MAAFQDFLCVIFVLTAFTASRTNAYPSDFAIPIPEVTVSIGGSVSSIPVQHEELIVPVVFNPVQNYQAPQANVYQDLSYMPPPLPQVIVLNDGGQKNDYTWLLLLLLLR
ncbi:uncharacterized protein LOC114362915 [Ostrinia furnacalis]|uniref:uncharacterized protein LOC114362915 n=1 Tax=Ostrinia furnacalis TaxID=93504 RepID=UPI00103E0502|nr:uncharacterized protein LOC114362915 [Ostrinia furnacalis]